MPLPKRRGPSQAKCNADWWARAFTDSTNPRCNPWRSESGQGPGRLNICTRAERRHMEMPRPLRHPGGEEMAEWAAPVVYASRGAGRLHKRQGQGGQEPTSPHVVRQSLVRPPDTTTGRDAPPPIRIDLVCRVQRRSRSYRLARLTLLRLACTVGDTVQASVRSPCARRASAVTAQPDCFELSQFSSQRIAEILMAAVPKPPGSPVIISVSSLPGVQP